VSHRRARGRSFPGARAPGTPRGRGGTARRLLAWAVMAAAFGGLAALVTFAAVTDRGTVREVAAGAVLFVVLVVAAAWLRRDILHGRRL